MRRTHFPFAPALLLTGALVLSGCATTGTERGAGAPGSAGSSASADTPDGAETNAEAPSVEAAPEGEPQVEIVDTSPGGPKEQDPLWAGLEEAAAGNGIAYLDVHLRSAAASADTGTVPLTPDTPDSVTVTVPEEGLDDSASPWYRITGTFSVEQIAESAFVLETQSTEIDADLELSGPSTEERCTAEGANEDIMGAAERLAEDPGAHEELRSEWGSSPEVWWGIQLTAGSLRSSDGNFAGDFLSTACADYL